MPDKTISPQKRRYPLFLIEFMIFITVNIILLWLISYLDMPVEISLFRIVVLGLATYRAAVIFSISAIERIVGSCVRFIENRV